MGNGRFALLILVVISFASSAWTEQKQNREPVEATADVEEPELPPVEYGELDTLTKYEHPKTKTPHIPPMPMLERYFDFKDGLRGWPRLTYAVDYSPIFQWGGGESNANQELNLIGLWNLTNSERSGKGDLLVWFQHALTLGQLTTGELMESLGLLSPINGGDTSPEKSGNRLQLLAWEHFLAGESIRLMGGKITSRVTLDQNRYAVSDREDFFSPMIVNNTVVPFTARAGLGLFGQWRRDRWYASALFRDADAASDFIDFDSLGTGNWEYAAELGMTPEITAAGTGNYRLTYYYTDAIGEGETHQPAGWTFSLSFDQDLGQRLGAFFRFAYADTPLRTFRRRTTAGIQLLEALGYEDDRIGVGWWWGDPTNSALRDEHGLELFWRIQIASIVELTPHFQLVVHPALEPERAARPLAGLRIRAVF